MKGEIKFSSLFDHILNIFTVISSVLSVLMMLGISTEVFTRYFFNFPILGITEFSESILLYITFLASAWLLREEGHVSMDFVVKKLKPKKQAILNCCTSIISAGISFFLFWYGALVTIRAFRQGTLEISGLEINIGWTLLVIPLGSLPLLIQFIRRAIGFWEKFKSNDNSSRKPLAPSR